ncbi:MAG TPA: PKD domain-containing protein [Candidatus Angelobacter sp.]
MHKQYSLPVIIFFLCSLLPASAATKFQATTTLAAETANNTSAADSFLTQSDGNIGAGNISKVPLRTALYPGATAKIYAHFMPWFGFSNHMNVGYASNDALQVQKQVNDMVSRGLDGVIIDWYGAGNSTQHRAYDQTTQYIMQQALLHPGFSFAIMLDQGSFSGCGTGCDITQSAINDLNYANTTYWGSPAYQRSGGRPVVYFFIDDSKYAIDWARVRNGVAGNPLLVFRNSGAFTHAQSDGGFSWVAPETVSSTNLMAITYLDNYDKTALANPAKYSIASAYKGFNDSLAAWGAGRVIGQQCGQTWLQTLKENGKYYSTTNQLLGIQLVTWNDYEEGSEFESGVDNCVTVSAKVTGSVVSWSITGQANTVDHFSVFASQDGQNLMWLANAAAGVSSMDLAQFGLDSGTYTVFVKAIGMPSMTNKISAGAPWTIAAAANQPPVAALSLSATSAYAPATISASAAGSSDPDGTLAGTSINFGDGSTAMAGTSASHTYSAAGAYTVTATVTDNMGATSSMSKTVTVKPPEVIVSAPAAGAQVTSPVRVTASGFSGYPVTTMQVYLDGVLAYTGNAPTLDTSIAASGGAHTLTVKAWDSSGRNFMSQVNVTVPVTNQPPVAALSLNATSLLVGGSVTASTAGSSDPDGSIAGVSINFGDGSATVNGVSAAHQYKTAGAYTVKATVTDNQGAVSSTSKTVTVKAQYVTITSPTFTSTTNSSVHVVGTAFSGYKINATQVYLDGVLKYQTASSTADTTLALTVGTHRITVKGWDASGVSFMSVIYLTRN